jgi:hypothetical protein
MPLLGAYRNLGHANYKDFALAEHHPIFQTSKLDSNAERPFSKAVQRSPVFGPVSLADAQKKLSLFSPSESWTSTAADGESLSK